MANMLKLVNQLAFAAGVENTLQIRRLVIADDGNTVPHGAWRRNAVVKEHHLDLVLSARCVLPKDVFDGFLAERRRAVHIHI